MKESLVATQFLSGGIGKRLQQVTDGVIPKCFVEIAPGKRWIDVLLEEFGKQGLTGLWGADFYYYLYNEVLQDTSDQIFWAKPGGVVEAIHQIHNTVLSIAVDCVFSPADIRGMIEAHKPGTITWAVTQHNNNADNMDGYRGMDIATDGSITGRSDMNITRSPVVITDHELVKQFRTPINRGFGEDFYREFLQRVEQENKERIAEGRKSILNAYFLSTPIHDFGTPDRLDSLKDNWEKIEKYVRK